MKTMNGGHLNDISLNIAQIKMLHFGLMELSCRGNPNTACLLYEFIGIPDFYSPIFEWSNDFLDHPMESAVHS